jgi:LysR family transcriptional regulator, glycine cleavage system transcriptional activator
MASRPPLNALRVFCSAAEAGSFQRAAQGLCITPGAVSRQIQSLEEHMGAALFTRHHRLVQLTRAGEALFARIAPQMAAIEAEVALLRSGKHPPIVRVDATVGFAMHWLIPRLNAFHTAHPGVDVRISTSDGPANLAARADLYVRRKPTEFSGMVEEPFLDEHCVVVASPGGPALENLTRLAKKYPRIAQRSRPELWAQWRQHHGLPTEDGAPTLTFDNSVLAIQAAIQGLGALVVPELLVTSLLESQRLVLLHPDPMPSGTYHLLRRSSRCSAAVMTFAQWLLKQGAR